MKKKILQNKKEILKITLLFLLLAIIIWTIDIQPWSIFTRTFAFYASARELKRLFDR